MIPTAAPTCPLCASSDAPALWRNDKLRVVAIDDADYPGYIRVIWRAHAGEMTDLDDGDRLHVMQVVLEAEAAMRDRLAPDKINLASLGNVVPHLHWHVIPRWRGDRHFPDSVWSAPRVAPGTESEGFQARLREAAARVPEFHADLRERLAARFPAG